MDENSNDIDQLFKEAAQHAAGLAYVLDPSKAIERGTIRRRFARRRRIALSGFVVVVAVVVFLVPLPQLHLFGSIPTRTAKGQHPSTTSSVTAIGQPGGVPAGFEPASASLLSPASGFVLGGVNCPSLATLRPCAARLVATTDGGVHWHFLKAPSISLFNSARALSSVVFASSRDGWLFRPGLWSTHDGGAHWRKLSLGGAIEAMAASSGTVYAVVEPSTHGSEELFASPVGRDAWARVGRMTAAGATLAVSGRSAWFVSTSLWTTADGVHWHQYPFRCPGAHYRLASIAAASASDVLFLCTGPGAMGSMDKEVLSSTNGGRTVHLVGQAPFDGTGSQLIAVPPSRGNVITLATTSGATWLDRSADGGKTWVVKEVKGSSGGAPLNSLSYVSTTVGWVVLGQPGLGSDSWLLRTSDAGVTWNKVDF